MYEYIIALLIGNKTESLLIVEPLYCTFVHSKVLQKLKMGLAAGYSCSMFSIPYLTLKVKGIPIFFNTNRLKNTAEMPFFRHFLQWSDTFPKQYSKPVYSQYATTV